MIWVQLPSDVLWFENNYIEEDLMGNTMLSTFCHCVSEESESSR